MQLSMNVPATPIRNSLATRSRQTVGFWREDFTAQSFTLEPRWRQEHGLAVVQGAETVRQWLTHVHPGDRAALLQAEQTLISKQTVDIAVEYRLQSPERGWFWVEHRGHIVDRGADGRPLSAAGVIVDIDREKKLRLADNLIAAQRDVALWGADLGLYDWDLRGDTLRWLNDWAARHTIDPIAGHDATPRWLAFVHPDERGMLGILLENFRSGQLEEFRTEYRCRDRNGQWLWLAEHARIVARDARGAPLRASGVRQNVSELMLLRGQIPTAADNNSTEITQHRQLERALLDAAGREQQRIGNDLHDGIGQELTGAALMLQACLRDLRGGGSKHASAVGEVVSQLNRTIKNTRALAHGLSPLAQEIHGLPGALDNMVARLKGRAGPKLVFINRLTQSPLALGVAAHHLLQIAQEAVSNALKHAAATVVTVELGPTDAGIYLSVRDNGRGFPDANSSPASLGLKLMQYRVRLLAADLQVHSAYGQGTTITCRCPVNSMQISAERIVAGDSR